MSQPTKKKTRIPLLWKVALMALLISGVYDLYYVYYALPRFETMAVDGQEAKGTERVEVATGMLESYYSLETSGAATRDQAQSLAVEALGSVQYDGDQGEGPFWATDDAGMLLLDASRPELVNTYVGDLRDGEGSLVFRTAGALAGSGSEALYRVEPGR